MKDWFLAHGWVPAAVALGWWMPVGVFYHYIWRPAEAELERVKAERDEAVELDEKHAAQRDELQDRLDKALSALREIRSAGHVGPEQLPREGYMAHRAIAEIEGEAS